MSHPTTLFGTSALSSLLGVKADVVLDALWEATCAGDVTAQLALADFLEERGIELYFREGLRTAAKLDIRPRTIPVNRPSDPRDGVGAGDTQQVYHYWCCPKVPPEYLQAFRRIRADTRLVILPNNDYRSIVAAYIRLGFAALTVSGEKQ